MAKEMRLESNNTVFIDGEPHPVEFGNHIENTEYSYTIRPYVFKDELGKSRDGCVFDIPKNQRTKAVRILKGYNPQDIAIDGQGYFVAVDNNGKVFWTEIGPEPERYTFKKQSAEESITNPLIDWRESGFIAGCFIAGNRGLKVLELCSSPYNPDFEKEVIQEEPDIPQMFFNLIRGLRGESCGR